MIQLTPRAFAFAGGLSAVLSACIPVPVNYVAEGSRANVGKDEMAFIVVGKTTRRQILLRLGEPDSLKKDESEYAYRVTRVHLMGVPIAEGARVVEMATGTRYYVIGFDHKGVVSTRRETADKDFKLI